MKILIINSVCGIRSTGRIVSDLAEKYLSEGHECKIAYGRENVPIQYKDIVYRIETNLSAKVNAFIARILDNEGFNAMRETKKFLEWATEYNPDVLWLHNLHGYYINIELLFDWIKSRPSMRVKWTLHDCWAFTGHCSYFTVAKCDKWKKYCGNCIQKKAYPKSLFIDNSRNNYQRKKQCFAGIENLIIITPSNWLANLVRQSFLKDYPIVVQYNTINTEVFKPTASDFRQRYGLQKKKIVLGVASSWSESKGLNDFIKLSKMMDDTYKIVLVGLTPRQQKKISREILTINRTNNAIELAKIYSAADVFVNPTHQDNYPTVNLESRACGTPVITYNVGGSPESAGHQHIVEENDIDSLFYKIKEIVG